MILHTMNLNGSPAPGVFGVGVWAVMRYDVPMNNNSRKFAPVDVDNIYVATYSPWFFLSATAMVGEEISEFEVDDLESGDKYIVNAESLQNAAESILKGEHVGSMLSSQCAVDFTDWERAPEYGVPFDSELSDCIIQIAALGEVVYG